MDALPSFQKLKVWQAGKSLAVDIYRITQAGIFSQDYGLRDQVRRAAVSIASNIAEGDERDTDKDAVRFFFIAKGSTAEVLTQLIIAYEIGYIPRPEFEHLKSRCLSVSRMLAGLIAARR